MSGSASALGDVDSSSLANVSADVLNLAVGHPAACLLPHDLLSQACAAVTPARWVLNYGRIAGENSVREAVAAWLASSEHSSTVHFGADSRAARPPGRVNAAEVFITAGVSHGLDSVCAAIASKGDVAVVVRPTYFLAAGVLRDWGLELVEVDADEDSGLDVDKLEALLQQGLRPRIVYAVTTHANPTGRTLTPAARQRLVQLAQQYRFFIIADEVYQLLSWGQPVPPRMRAYVPPDAEDGGSASTLDVTPANCVVSIGSFTKILAPGLRVGWIEAAPSVLERLSTRGYLVSGGGVTPFASQAVREVLTSGGQDAHLASLRAELQRRCDAMCDALRHNAVRAGGWTFTQPQGGYFLWLRLPDGMSGAALAAAARTNGVAVLDGATCCANTDGIASTGVANAGAHVRLCFAYLGTEQIVRGVEKLADAAASLQ